MSQVRQFDGVNISDVVSHNTSSLNSREASFRENNRCSGFSAVFQSGLCGDRKGGRVRRRSEAGLSDGFNLGANKHRRV